jgi:diguanylate cyclase (GGDEF)-like protein
VQGVLKVVAEIDQSGAAGRGAHEAVQEDELDDDELLGDLRRLGEALLESVEEVIASVTARAHRKRELEGQPILDEAVEESFERLGTLSTAAVARWIAGETVDEAFAAGEEFSRAFAQMVASSDVPLGEVVRRCQYWREGCEGVLLGAPDALARDRACELARQSIHLAADHSLATMSAIFDAERHRVQQELTRRQEELAFLATHDGLTKLANRSLVVERLEQMLDLDGEAEEERGVAVVFIDLDGFKEINDTLGHSAGDRLLAATAARLRAAVREADTLGRLGGDEFVVLARRMSKAGALEGLARRLQDAFAEPFSISLEQGPLRITASIGVALARGGCTAAQLLHDADIAMYSAKARRSTAVRTRG